MNYRVISQYNGFQVCLGDYSEGLDIMFIRANDKIIDFGDGSYRFFNKFKPFN